MKEISKISEEKGTFILKSSNPARAVVLREMMFFRVKIFAVHAAIFHHNDSVLHDEHLAMLFANLVIDNELLDKNVEEYRARIKFTATFANRRVTVADIFMFDSSKNPFLYQDQLLTELKVGQKLFCDLIIRRKMYIEDPHCKYQACNLVTFTKEKDHFLFNVETTGALPLKKIVKRAMEALDDLPQNPSPGEENIFFARPQNFAD
jgi:hypothetical protein